MQKMQEELAEKEYSASSGGGMIKATLTGKGLLKSIHIDPSFFADSGEPDTEILEDLIVAAVNKAKEEVDADSANSLSGAFGGMDLPDGMKLPF